MNDEESEEKSCFENFKSSTLHEENKMQKVR